MPGGARVPGKSTTRDDKAWHNQQGHRRPSMLAAISGFVRAAGRCTPMLLLLCAGAATPAAAEIITIKDMRQGITITRQQCAQIKQAVWIKSYEQDFCVRYYLSTAGGEGSKPLVFLQGDKLGP